MVQAVFNEAKGVWPRLSKRDCAMLPSIFDAIRGMADDYGWMTVTSMLD